MSKLKVYAFADESSPFIDGQIEALRRNGLDGIEMRTVDELSISDITVEKAREVKQKFDDNGFRIFTLGSPLGKINIETDDFAQHMEKVKHTLELAQILGAENIRMFSFYMPKDKDPAPFKNEVIDRLSKMAEAARGSGVTLCHENEKGIYGDTAAKCLEILTAVDGLSAIFDFANFVQCGDDTLRAWEMLADRIKYLHIKDAREDGNVVPAGEGRGNIPVILKEYVKRGGICVTMEPHLSVFDALNSLEQAGEEIQVGNTYKFDTKEQAFDFAVSAFRKIEEEL